MLPFSKTRNFEFSGYDTLAFASLRLLPKIYCLFCVRGLGESKSSVRNIVYR